MKIKRKKTTIKRRSGSIGSSFSTPQKILLGLFGAFIIGGVAVLIFYYSLLKDLPSDTSIINYAPPVVTRVYDVRANLIGEFFEERRIMVTEEEMPAILKQAFIAIEDKRFFQHHGVDYHGIVRAFYENIRNMEFSQGASTISMQLARNFFLNREKTFSRKIKEAILAYRLESRFSKQEIFFLYLNHIYLGHGAYGVGAAADEYFGKKVGNLTLAECAALAALPKSPAHYDPFKNPKDAIERRNLVLQAMYDQGMISSDELKNATAAPLNLMRRDEAKEKASAYFVEYVRQYLIQQYGHDAVYTQGLTVFTTVDGDWNKYAWKAIRDGVRRQDRMLGWRGPVEHVEGEARDKYISESKKEYHSKPTEGDYVEGIITGLPNTPEAYAMIQIGEFPARIPPKEVKWISKLNLEPSEKIPHTPKPTSKLLVGDVVKAKILAVAEDGTLVAGLEQNSIVQGAALTIDPFTGEIKAMVGGRDFEDSEFNRAVQALRQPGSSFKPILYTAAIEAGYTPATVIVDTSLTLQGPNGPWKPKNYDGKFSGPRTVASALQHSINTIAVKLIQDVGVDLVISYARKMGITAKLNRDLSLALGTSSLTLLELVRAYGVLATEGWLTQPVAVRRVYGRDGKILENRVPVVSGYSAPPDDMDRFKSWSAKGSEPIWGDAGLAYRSAIVQNRGNQVLSPQTAYVMISMMRNVVERGTGTNARIPGAEIAGKTGTTSDYKDALFVGFTSTYVTGVWVGQDDGRLTLGRGATGGDVAAPIWQNYMYRVLQGHSISTFPRPDGAVTYSFDCLTGTYAAPDQTENICQAAFPPGTQPAAYAPPPDQGTDPFQNDFNPQDYKPNEGGQNNTPPETHPAGAPPPSAPPPGADGGGAIQ